LVEQAPPPITQTVNKLLEKTIERVVTSPAPSGDSGTPVETKSEIKVITQEDLIINLVSDTSSAVVSVIATKNLPVYEQYYSNPFGNDEFFKQFFPEFFQEFNTPQYQQKGTEEKQIGSGTGFFVSEDGYILSNKHVVFDTGAKYTVIMNNGKKLEAKVLARDPLQDIAILKVDGSGYNFIPLGDSDTARVGQSVIAIGNALGEFQNTVSVGVISGLNRTIVASDGSGQSEQLQSIIQTDAAVNPGNSGGPLLSLSGRAIGINTAMAQGAENISFALPINFAKKGIADAKEFGKIRYAFLGVRYVQINASVKEEKKLTVDYGVLLAKGSSGEPAIMPDGPAAKAGLREGDIILKFGDVRIDSANTLTSLIASRRVGETVKLEVLREGKTVVADVVLDERPEKL
jgi:serine protease Do